MPVFAKDFVTAHRWGDCSRAGTLLQIIANAIIGAPCHCEWWDLSLALQNKLGNLGANHVIARGGSPEAISQSLVSVILHSDFYLLLLSSNVVIGSSL